MRTITSKNTSWNDWTIELDDNEQKLFEAIEASLPPVDQVLLSEILLTFHHYTEDGTYDLKTVKNNTDLIYTTLYILAKNGHFGKFQRELNLESRQYHIAMNNLMRDIAIKLNPQNDLLSFILKLKFDSVTREESFTFLSKKETNELSNSTPPSGTGFMTSDDMHFGAGASAGFESNQYMSFDELLTKYPLYREALEARRKEVFDSFKTEINTSGCAAGAGSAPSISVHEDSPSDTMKAFAASFAETYNTLPGEAEGNSDPSEAHPHS